MESGFLALVLNSDNTPPYFTIHTGAVAISAGGVGRQFSGGRAAQRYDSVCRTLAHHTTKGAARILDHLVPFWSLGDQPNGAGRVALTCALHCRGNAWTNRNAWTNCASESSNSLTFVNPLGKFLSSVHNKPYREKPERGRLL